MPITEYHQDQPALTVKNLRFGASITNDVQRKLSLIFEQWMALSDQELSIASGFNLAAPTTQSGLLPP